METQLDRRWIWVLVALSVIVGASFLVGCGSTQKTEADPAGPVFGQHVAQTTAAINAGDLEAARSHLDRTRPLARTYEQKRKVQSLDQLIAGSEALMDGHVALAAAEWSRIEDPVLNREVRVKARVIGVDVPLMPAPAMTKEGVQ